DVHDNEHGSIEIFREISGQFAQSVDSARRCANDDDIAFGHGEGNPLLKESRLLASKAGTQTCPSLFRGRVRLILGAMPARKSAAKKATSSAKKTPERKTKQRAACPIAGIGGSAGAFEAAMELLRNLPQKTGMA